MQCPHSRLWFVGRSGKLTDVRALAREPIVELKIPCGECIVCKAGRGRDWSTRLICEAVVAGFANTCFITLTLHPDVYKEVRTTRELLPLMNAFWKRLRHLLDRERVKAGLPPVRIRMATTLEYGESNWRVHAHALVFGYTFERELWSLVDKSEAGENLYASPVLSMLWPHGRAVLQDFHERTAVYMCRHMVNKISGTHRPEDVQLFDSETGEVVPLTKEFQTRSVGIGRAFYEMYPGDVYNPKGFRLGERVVPVPRRFDMYHRLKGRDGHVAATVEELRADRDREDVNALTPHLLKRRAFAETPQQLANNTPERLATREESLTLKINRKKRQGF